MEAPATTVLLLASVAGLWARGDFGLPLFAGAVLLVFVAVFRGRKSAA